MIRSSRVQSTTKEWQSVITRPGMGYPMSWNGTYASTVDSIIDPAKLFHCRGNEALHTLLIGYVQPNGDGSIPCLFGIFLALFGSLLRTFFIEICENDSVNTSLGECKASVFADS